MINLGEENYLGPRSFLLLLLQRVSGPGILFLGALVLWGLSGSITAQFGRIALSAAVNPSTLAGWISGSLWALLLISVLLIALQIGISWLIYHHYRFMLELYDIKIRKGIFNIKEISIPYRQIQDVNVDRSLFYRLLGVSKVIITTAGQEAPGERDESDGVLDPIDRDVAENIRQELERRIGVQLVEHPQAEM